jgi:hypothetical protein
MFGKSKPAPVNHVAVFEKALAEAIGNAQEAGIGAGSLLARLEAAAEGLRWSAPVSQAANEAWAAKERKRLERAAGR